MATITHSVSLKTHRYLAPPRLPTPLKEATWALESEPQA